MFANGNGKVCCDPWKYAKQSIRIVSISVELNLGIPDCKPHLLYSL